MSADGTHTHNPCCSSHNVNMTCERYRKTHFVGVRPCCTDDAKILTGPLTSSEWREFQNIPDQGYSHRGWVDWKITQRVHAMLEQAAQEADRGYLYSESCDDIAARIRALAVPADAAGERP